MYPSRFRYEAPRSLGEAIGLLREGGDDVKVLAGGQSLVPLMKLRFASPEGPVGMGHLQPRAGKRPRPRYRRWAWGYQKRFGIVFVDFGSRRRILKSSARFYSGVARANAVPPLPSAGTR